MAQDGKTQREVAERAPQAASAEQTGPPKLPLLPRDMSDTPLPMPKADLLPKADPLPKVDLPPKIGAPPKGSPLSNIGTVKPSKNGPDSAPAPEPAGRRAAKRRPAGPARPQVAANDRAPRIGGLIFALQQKPSHRPFLLAAMASGVWLAIGALLAWALLASDASGSVWSSPMLVVVLATVLLPIALFWFLATLGWRTQELKLMS